MGDDYFVCRDTGLRTTDECLRLHSRVTNMYLLMDAIPQRAILWRVIPRGL